MPEGTGPRALHWVGSMGLDVVRCEVLRNPATPWVLRFLGGRHTLKFQNGFEFPVDPSTRIVGEKLISLAYEGASFRSSGPDDGFTWLVDRQAGEIVTPSGLKFSLESLHPLIFAETFIYDIHFCGFHLNGQLVVDVGSNVGDTPLYFARQGARVVGYEPDSDNYRMLSDNLRRNPELAGRIQTYPEPVGEDGEVTFFSGQGGSSGVYSGRGVGKKVHSVGLKTILDRAGVKDAYLLKADCKGAEFQLVRQPEIAAFRYLQVEYTADLVDQHPSVLLEELRKRGFSRFRLYKHNYGAYPITQHGTVFALRDDVESRAEPRP
ncbi:MAG: FkbM family methyltransferase [Thermoplasmata archaeon]|nr:FkbM family methyltransferase [Thermoplasmata archaeon]